MWPGDHRAQTALVPAKHVRPPLGTLPDLTILQRGMAGTAAALSRKRGDNSPTPMSPNNSRTSRLLQTMQSPACSFLSIVHENSRGKTDAKAQLVVSRNTVRLCLRKEIGSNNAHSNSLWTMSTGRIGDMHRAGAYIGEQMLGKGQCAGQGAMRRARNNALHVRLPKQPSKTSPAPKERSNREVARRNSRAQFRRNEDCTSTAPSGPRTLHLTFL